MLSFLDIVAAGLLALVISAVDAHGLYSPDVDEAVSMLNRNRHLKEPQSLLSHFVNPLLPMLICDWHYGADITDTDGVNGAWPPNPRCLNTTCSGSIVTRPLNTSNVRNVQPCESVCVDHTAFESFVSTVLPLLEVKVLLFTYRWNLPALIKSSLTDAVRTHHHVAHWFAQNPLYTEDERYSAFPYGISPSMLRSFGEAFLTYHQGNKPKLQTLEHLHISATHPSRHRLIARSEAASKHAPLQGPAFYKSIANTQFLISPRGDRPECYRHWEAIGLGAIPVANINSSLYGPLFGNDMMYVDDADQLLELLDNPRKLAGRYQAPRSHRVLTTFWSKKVAGEQRHCRDSLSGAQGVLPPP